MRFENHAKRTMEAGKPAFGYALGYGSAIAAEALAGSGIDFILLDGQHGSFGPESTIASLAAMRAGGAVPMARVTRNDYSMIGRMLDEGALGPDEHNLVLDAVSALNAAADKSVHFVNIGDGRAAAFLPARSPLNDLLGLAMIIADAKFLDAKGAARFVTPTTTNLMRRLAFLRRPPAPLEGAIWVETIPFNETRDYVKKVLANAMIYNQALGGATTSLTTLLGTIAPRSASNMSTAAVQ